MSYYRGDYYRGDYYRGGIFGGIAKAVGKVAGAVIKATPVGRAVTTAVSLGSSLLGSRSPAPLPAIPGPVPAFNLPPAPGTTVTKGRATAGVSPLGTVGLHIAKGRRMNAGNAKAARRAIRRIKAVRHLLQGIEREMPKRTVRVGGSPGRITRAEAARALRA